jgi:hypothetical protein
MSDFQINWLEKFLLRIATAGLLFSTFLIRRLLNRKFKRQRLVRPHNKGPFIRRSFRMTLAEHKKLKREADSYNMSIPSYIHMSLFSDPITYGVSKQGGVDV